jgi:hypothetical protein
VAKYGTARQATDGNIIRRMRFPCRITNATDTHSEYIILTAIPQEQLLRQSASIIIRTLPVAFFSLQKLKFFCFNAISFFFAPVSVIRLYLIGIAVISSRPSGAFLQHSLYCEWIVLLAYKYDLTARYLPFTAPHHLTLQERVGTFLLGAINHFSSRLETITLHVWVMMDGRMVSCGATRRGTCIGAGKFDILFKIVCVVL